MEFDQLTDEFKDLEKLLSRAQIAKEFITEYKISTINIPALITKCKQVIKEKCTIELASESPHITLLNKVTNRKLKDPRVKIFTLNYDTLFEQAAVKGEFTIID